MSNIALLERTIYDLEESFNQVSVDTVAINFRKEAEFAIQVIGNNSFALGIATSNPQSVRDAVTNIAAIGISLNPAKKQAYLVPRDGKICLDLSYMGLIEMAVASGSIRWAKAEIVRKEDRFQLNGFDRPPHHDYSPFSKDRGEIVGVYVVAKTADGDYLTDTMTIDEVYAIRNRGAAWKKSQSGPWKTDEGEMIKKTIIKRAYKTWPRTDRLDNAVHYLNTDGGEGIDLSISNSAPAKEEQAFNPQQSLADIQRVNSLTELDALWKKAVHGCKTAKDKVSYDRIKAAVVQRGNALKGAAIPDGVEA